MVLTPAPGAVFLLELLAQLDARSIADVAEGGTKGLITGLVCALAAVTSALVWTVRRHLKTLDDHAAALLEQSKAHASALKTERAENATLVAELTRVSTALGTVASSLAGTLETSGDVARVLEFALEHGIGHKPPGRNSR